MLLQIAGSESSKGRVLCAPASLLKLSEHDLSKYLDTAFKCKCSVALLQTLQKNNNKALVKVKVKTLLPLMNRCLTR